MLTNSEECTDIYRRGIAANDTLNENEQIRFRMLGMHLLRVFHECFEQQYEGGYVNPDGKDHNGQLSILCKLLVCKRYGQLEGTGFLMIFRNTWTTSLNDQRLRQSPCPSNRNSRLIYRHQFPWWGQSKAVM